MSNCFIRPIPLCKGLRDRSQWTYRFGYGEKVASCNYLWYIEGLKRGILVDGGTNAGEFRKRGILDEDIQSAEAGFRTIGIDPEDIEIVILTHLHWDHVGLVAKFPNATFFLQKKEFDFAINPHPAVTSSFCKKEVLMNLKLELIEGDREIVEGINILITPGHTPGGQSVAVATTKGLAIITGFCCTLENFFPSAEIRAKGFEVVAPGIHIDMLQAYDSVLRVKQLADIVIPLHDPKFLEMERIP